LNQHFDKTKKSLKKSSFIWRLPGPPAFAREASEGCRAPKTKNIENNPMQSSNVVDALSGPAKTF
jgi:hypothetical protein